MTNTEREIYKALIEVMRAQDAVRIAENVTRDLNDVRSAHTNLWAARIHASHVGIPDAAIDSMVDGVRAVVYPERVI